MYLIEVIPITRSAHADSLTYFSSTSYNPGSVIDISLRSREIKAIVLHSTVASNAKGQLRSSAHKLKKIDRQTEQRLVSPEFVRAALSTATVSASFPSAILFRLIPQSLLTQNASVTNQNKDTTKTVSSFNKKTVAKNKSTAGQRDTSAPKQHGLIHTPASEERFALYRAKIREEFAKGCSVLIIAPTIYEAKILYECLTKGIEQYSIFVTGSMPRKEFASSWIKALSADHAVVVIGTVAAASIPIANLSLIIIENEADSAWRQPGRPHIDSRVFLQFLSENLATDIIFGGSVVRPETFEKWRDGRIIEVAEPRFRLLSGADMHLEDMRPDKSEALKQNQDTPTVSTKPKFAIIGQRLLRLLKQDSTANEKFVLFASRAGLAPLTVCHDCGEALTCNRCSAPTVLYELHSDSKKGTDASFGHGRFYLCRKCGDAMSAKRICKQCGGWNLVPLGIGADLVTKEVSTLFPTRPLFSITSDNSASYKKIDDTISRFISSRGGILVCTAIGLRHLVHQNRHIEHTAVISIDSLLSLPDFRVNEKVFSIILKLRALADKTFTLQTRRPDDQCIEQAARGDILGFYRNELAARKALLYPPFTFLIKLQVRGSETSSKEEMVRIKKFLSDYKPIIYRSFTKIIHGNFIMNALIKLPPDSWPDELLISKLRSLPRHISVEVDPESVL